MSRKVLIVSLFVTLVTVLSVALADAQGPKPGTRLPQANAGTAFTYQGQLKNNGTAVNGSCNFQFGLWDASSGGSQVSGTISQTLNVTVTNSLFTTPIDFGASAFNGGARYLGIAVACPSGTLTPMSTRQALTPAPMALALPGMYTRQNATSPNVIGGYSGNVISPTVVGGTIGGGGYGSYPNRVWVDYGTIGGGAFNTTSGFFATVGGGDGNTASNNGASIGGGAGNTASGINATISGGASNTASGEGAFVGGGGWNGSAFAGNLALATTSTIAGGYGNTIFSGADYATIGGGFNNTANGAGATVPGGNGNLAGGANSFAAGTQSHASHDGSFVWADNNYVDFSSIASNQFLVRAGNGVGINTNNTTANALTVNGKVIAGGTGVPSGSSEPFVSRGSNSGMSMDDRLGGANPRWVMYPTSSVLFFYNTTSSNVVAINASGKLTALGGFAGQCLNGSNFNGAASNACNMDFAESFQSIELTTPGDLVALVNAPNSAPTVRRSTSAYEDLTIGVVSQNPGLVFDNGTTRMAGDNSQLITQDKTIVALVGRVAVKVSLENGIIAIGDPLTSSSIPGHAMKATRAGKIIGYAMEAATTEGLAMTLIQPGYYLPASQIDAQKQIADLETRLAALEQNANTNNNLNVFGFGILLIGAMMVYRARKDIPK